MVKAVRGATALVERECKEMEEALEELYLSLIRENRIRERKIVSILFSQTGDIDFANPATLLRKKVNLSQIPLFCCREPDYPHSLPLTIRVLITWRGHGKRVKPVYLREAVKLRPDVSRA